MTRVLDYGDESNYAARSKPTETWRVYARLARYALRYKARLALVLVLSIVVATSFTSMIFGAGTAIKILYSSEEEAAELIASYTNSIRGGVDAATGTAVSSVREDAAERFERLAESMRADRAYAIRILCVGLVALTALAGIARFLQEFYAGAIGAYISVELNREMFASVVKQSHRFFEQRQVGEVVARFTNDAFMVNKGLTNVFVKVLREPVKALFFLVTALLVDPLLTLAVFCVLPPALFVIQRVGKRVKKSARGSLQKVAAMASVIQETVRGIAVIKSFRMEAYQSRRVDSELSKLQKYLIRMARADAAIGPATELILVVGLVVLVILSERRISNGTLAPGDLVMLFGALAFMLDPLRKLASVNNLVQTSVASAERVFEYIDMQPDVTETPGAVAIGRLQNSLRFEDVWFSYNGEKDVLRGIDLEVKRGEMVALVGFSGSGKSTMAKLVPRFYDTARGRITIDGTDIKNATLAGVRDQISVVTQETILFYETVRGNIAFGRADLTEERVKGAADAAHATEFIEKLPNRFDELLGEDGGNLSGGQRQRIAIARALVKDPAILILDEATSNLDSESEKAIQDAMTEFVRGRTTIVIAHRLSTVRQADRIVVLNDGQIAEQGTHAELLKRGGLYTRLYKTQFESGEREAS